MPSQKTISDLASALHQKKILNIDTSLRDTLGTESSLLNGPDLVADWNIVGGSHYVLVTGLSGALDKISTPAEITRAAGRVATPHQ